MSLAMDTHSGSPSDSHESTDIIDIPEDPTKVFGELVDGNHRVCKQCYRRLRERRGFSHRVGSKHYDLLQFVFRDVPEESKFQYLDTEYFEHPTIPERAPRDYPPEEQRTNKLRGRRHCWNCGTFDHHRTPDTRSKDEAVTVGINISVTLEEYGLQVDWVALTETVRELKSRPALAGDDNKVFSRAVAAAVDVEQLQEVTSR